MYILIAANFDLLPDFLLNFSSSRFPFSALKTYASFPFEIGKFIEELTPGKVVYVKSPDYHRRIDVGNIIVDNTKIKQLGWDWKVSVKEGLKKTLEYYQKMESESSRTTK